VRNSKRGRRKPARRWRAKSACLSTGLGYSALRVSPLACARGRPRGRSTSMRRSQGRNREQRNKPSALRHGGCNGAKNASFEIRKGEIGCLFDEIQNLVEPIERRDMDGSAGRSEAGAGASRPEVTPLGRRCRARVRPDDSLTRLHVASDRPNDGTWKCRLG